MTDKFSFQRIDQIWSFYHPAIMRQWIWTIIAVVALFQIAVLARATDSIALFLLVNTLMCAPVYLGPLVFTYYNDRAMQIQLPATACEKATFYLFHSLIVIPLAVLVLWLSLNGLSSIWNDGETIYTYFTTQLMDGLNVIGVNYMSWKFVLQRSFTELLPVSAALYTVLAARTHRVIKGIAAAISTLIAYGILSGIAGFITAYNNLQGLKGMSEPEIENASSHLATIVMTDIVLAMSIFAAVFNILFIYLIYRKVKRMQD